MTAAAGSTHLSQRVVSQQVARLEEHAGPLFLRGRRNLRLSAAGEQLLEETRRLLASNGDLWVATKRCPSSHVSVSVRLTTSSNLA